MTWDYSCSHQHIPKKSKTSCTAASSVVPLISMAACCYAYECKYSERNMWSVHFILSIVIWTPLELQLMAGTERLCHIFEWGRELMSYFRMGSRDEKGWEPLGYSILPPAHSTGKKI